MDWMESQNSSLLPAVETVTDVLLYCMSCHVMYLFIVEELFQTYIIQNFVLVKGTHLKK